MAVLFHEPLFATIVESGDRLYFYQLETTTDLTVYLDAGLGTPAGQPVVANANGQFPAIYIDSTGAPPRVVLEDRNGVEKWTLPEFPIEDLSAIGQEVDRLSADLEEVVGDILDFPGQIESLEQQIAGLVERIVELEAIELPPDLSDQIPKARASVIGTSNPQLNNNTGFSDIQNTGPGTYVLAFNQAMPDTDYQVLFGFGPLQDPGTPLAIRWTNKLTNSVTVETWRTTGGSTNTLSNADFDILIYE